MEVKVLPSSAPTGLTVEKIRIAKEYLSRGCRHPLCTAAVAVLGDGEQVVYPCRLEEGHEGRCEPDYDAGP